MKRKDVMPTLRYSLDVIKNCLPNRKGAGVLFAGAGLLIIPPTCNAPAIEADVSTVPGRIECRATDGVGPDGLPTAQCYSVNGVPFDHEPEINGVMYQAPFAGTETVDMNGDGEIDEKDGAVFTVHQSAG